MIVNCLKSFPNLDSDCTTELIGIVLMLNQLLNYYKLQNIAEFYMLYIILTNNIVKPRKNNPGLNEKLAWSRRKKNHTQTKTKFFPKQNFSRIPS